MNISAFAATLALFAISYGSAFAESSFVYRWEDDNRSIHITNRPDEIPDKYRETANRMKVVTIKSVGHAPGFGPARVDSFEAIHFDKSKTGVIVPAVIDRKVERNAIIDTGSEWVVITSKLARALGLDIENLQKNHFRVFGGRVLAPVARLGSVRVGPAVAKNIDAAIIDFEGRGHASAIIGMNFLSRFAFEIDHSKGTLTFLPGE